MKPIQALVAKLYADGDFAYIEKTEEAAEVGDTLFEFLVSEANDADTITEFQDMLDTVIDQLESLKLALDNEVIEQRAAG